MVMSLSLREEVELLTLLEAEALLLAHARPSTTLLYPLRLHQQRLYDDRTRFNVWVAHRRFGKTFLSLYCLLYDALHCQAPYPRFAYVAPLRNQAKTIVWDVLKRTTQDWPGVSVNEAELRVDLARGSRIQLFGADNPDALRGMYLDGVVFDEYAQMRPRTWTEVVRPVARDGRSLSRHPLGITTFTICIKTRKGSRAGIPHSTAPMKQALSIPLNSRPRARS
jgi:hypothetical protein